MRSIDSAQYLALASLYADYAAALDAGDLDRWPDFFTEDCNYRRQPRENFDRGLPTDAGQHMLAELCGWQVGYAENQLAEALMRGMYACWCRSDTDRCEASCVASSR